MNHWLFDLDKIHKILCDRLRENNNVVYVTYSAVMRNVSFRIWTDKNSRARVHLTKEELQCFKTEQEVSEHILAIYHLHLI